MTDAKDNPNTISAVVRKAIIDGGFDGLFNDWGECSCDLADLFPCGECHEDCEMGVKAPCPEECGEGCDFHIVAKVK